MATLTELYSGSASISTTEYSLTLSSTTGVPASKTEDGYIQIWLDLNALASGDDYELNVYEKVRSAGTQRKVYTKRFIGAQSPPNWLSIPIAVMHAWDVTLDKIAGTDRTIEWSIRSP